jgi:hypothetical protein
MEEAFEEGQGPHRAVEPVMMFTDFTEMCSEVHFTYYVFLYSCFDF